MSLPLIAKSLISFILFVLCFRAFFRRIGKFRSAKSGRVGLLGQMLTLFCWALLLLWTGLPKAVILFPVTLIAWNILVWPSLLLTICLATVTLLDFGGKGALTQYRKQAWWTLIQIFLFMIAFAFIISTEYPEFILQRTENSKSMSWIDEQMDKFRNPTGSIPESTVPKYQSSQFYYIVVYGNTPWEEWVGYKEGYPKADFGLSYNQRAFFLIYPFYVLSHEKPDLRIFVNASLQNLELEPKRLWQGKWERQQQNGYEGFVFDFEEMIQEKMQASKIEVLVGDHLAYAIKSWADAELIKEQPNLLQNIHNRVRLLEAEPLSFSNHPAWGESETLRHEQFYRNVEELSSLGGDLPQIDGADESFFSEEFENQIPEQETTPETAPETKPEAVKEVTQNKTSQKKNEDSKKREIKKDEKKPPEDILVKKKSGEPDAKADDGAGAGRKPRFRETAGAENAAAKPQLKSDGKGTRSLPDIPMIPPTEEESGVKEDPEEESETDKKTAYKKLPPQPDEEPTPDFFESNESHYLDVTRGIVYRKGNPINHYESLKIAVKTIDHTGQSHVLRFSFDAEKEDIVVRRFVVLDNFGSIRAYGNDESYFIEEANIEGADIFSPKSTLHLPIPEIEPGDEINIRIERIRKTSALRFPFTTYAFQTEIPTQRHQFVVEGDIDKLDHKKQGKISEKRETNRILWTWLAKTQGAGMAVEEPPRIWISSGADSWRSEVRDYLARIQGSLYPSADEKNTAGKLTEGIDDPSQKIAVLMHHIKTDFALYPVNFNPYADELNDNFIKNKMGNSADLALYLLRLLRAVGVEAHPAMVKFQAELHKELPSLDQFNQMILYIPQLYSGSFIDLLFLDLQPGQLSPDLAGKEVLVLDPANPSFAFLTPRGAKYEKLAN